MESSLTPEHADTFSFNRYTVGNYFTDEAHLADFYARPFTRNADKASLHCIILARVLLGCSIVTTPSQFKTQQDFFNDVKYREYMAPSTPSETPDMTDFQVVHHDFAGARNSTIIMGTKGSTSEFVTYGKDLALPVALVFYRRVTKA